MVCQKCGFRASKKRCTDCKRARKYQGHIFHDLRRSAARNLSQAGVPREIAKKVTGHLSDSMWDRYNIVVTNDVREALEKTEKTIVYQAG
jgi:integrase